MYNQFANIGYSFNFDYSKFGLQLIKDKIVCNGQIVQEFTLSTRISEIEDLIVRQIIKANTFQLILNSKLVSVQYLKLLSGTELNSELLNKWVVNCQDLGIVKSFKILEFTFKI